MAYGFRRKLHDSKEATAAEGWSWPLGHISWRHQQTGSEVEEEGAYQLSKLTPDDTFYNKAPPPRVSMASPNSDTNWGPSLQAHESTGDIPHSSHHSSGDADLSTS